MNTFTCAVCKETFNKGLTDEEAVAQFAEEFPGQQGEPCVMVCDDCFQPIDPRRNLSARLLAIWEQATPEQRRRLRLLASLLSVGSSHPTIRPGLYLRNIGKPSEPEPATFDREEESSQ